MPPGPFKKEEELLNIEKHWLQAEMTWKVILSMSAQRRSELEKGNRTLSWYCRDVQDAD